MKKYLFLLVLLFSAGTSVMANQSLSFATMVSVPLGVFKEVETTDAGVVSKAATLNLVTIPPLSIPGRKVELKGAGKDGDNVMVRFVNEDNTKPSVVLINRAGSTSQEGVTLGSTNSTSFNWDMKDAATSGKRELALHPYGVVKVKGIEDSDMTVNKNFQVTVEDNLQLGKAEVNALETKGVQVGETEWYRFSASASEGEVWTWSRSGSVYVLQGN